MLLGEERGRDQHRDLLALHHRLESRADRDLGLAEPHVTADQAIHGLGQLHVVFDILDRGELISRLVVRERVLQLVLPRRVGSERMTLYSHADAVEADELAGHVLHGALDLGGGFDPIGAAEPVQPRRVAAQVARDHADLVARHEQPVALRVLQDQVVAFRSGERTVRDARVPPHTVDPMDGEVARLELVGDRVGAPPSEPRRRPRVPAGAEEVLLGGDGDLGGSRDEAVRERRLDRLDLDRRADELAHTLQGTMAARRDDQAVVAGGQVGQASRELGRVALRAPPVGEPHVEPLRELREMDLNVFTERLAERMKHVRARPADRFR